MSKNAAQQLIDYGTSVWYDNVSRDLLHNGEMKRLIAEWGVRGVTSNPTIFDKAIGGSAIYDSDIAAAKTKQLTPDQVFEELAINDIAQTADLLRPVFDSSKGEDGYVSIEVSPLLASDTKGTIEEARRLHKKLNRPNIMVKVPGTKEGIPSIRELLESGINVNITLLFSVENYREVALTYCEALKARKKKGLPIREIASVASFFVSRVDTAVDAKLDAIVKANESPERVASAKALRGKFGIANSKLAYKLFQQIFDGNDFAELKADGARVQRPLWASTSTKDPAYRDVVYVENLIGRNTVNTMPPATLAQFVDHGVVKETLSAGVDEAESVRQQLLDLGVDLDKVVNELQVDGVKKFADSFRALNETIAKKLA